jgi:hypothetical protein
MVRRWIVWGVALVAAWAISDSARAAKCFVDPGDMAQLADTRDAVDAACDCFGVASDLEYRICAFGVINARVEGALLGKQCRATAREVYKNSTCGRGDPNRRGPLTPCIKLTASGKVTCRARGGPCQDSGNTEYIRCEAHTHCLDAADTNGDLQIGGPGDSGACQPIPDTFIDHGDGTITDTRTGLMWEKLSDDGSVHDVDDEFTWADASAVKVASLNSSGGFAGYTDWRLPAVYELVTLLRGASVSNPGVAPSFDSGCTPGCTVLTCSCTDNDFYWTSSESPSDNPWRVFFNGIAAGSGGGASLGFRSSLEDVRAVRRAP